MMYPREIIEEIRTESDIVEIVSRYITLKLKGRIYFGTCPFHKDNTPSFSVNSEKQFFYCHSCGVGGDIFEFLLKVANQDFMESLKMLSKETGIELPEPENSAEMTIMANLKEKLFEIHKEAGLFYYNLLQSDVGENARKYLENRGLSEKICRKFGLGYSGGREHSLCDYLTKKGYFIGDIIQSGLVIESDNKKDYYDRFRNRLMFPIIDTQGRVIGFGARILEGQGAKYLNSPETPLFSKSRNLYGLNFAKKIRTKELILVEGYMDVISLNQGGFRNVVASLGTAFNKQHATNLKKYASDVILLYDSDDAGTNATLRAIPVLVENGLAVRVLQVKGGKDPDEFIKEYGANEFSKLLGEAVHYISFQIACSKKNFNIEILEEKVKFVTEVAKILANLDSEIERSVYLKEVSSLTNVEEMAISKEIDKILNKKQDEFNKNGEKQKKFNSKISMNNLTGAEKGIIEAQRSILYFCLNKKEIYDVVKKHINSSVFTIDVYKETFKLIGELYENDVKIYDNDVIGHFTGNKNQNYITKIYAEQLPPESKSDLEISLTEMIKNLKLLKINHDIKIVSSKSSEIDKALDKKSQEGQVVDENLYSGRLIDRLLKEKIELNNLKITL